MWGKCWITIIKNHSFHKSLHSIGIFSVLNTYLYQFHPAPKILQKEDKEWPSQLTFFQQLRHQNRVFNAPPFLFNKRFAPFFRGWTHPCSPVWFVWRTFGRFCIMIGQTACQSSSLQSIISRHRCMLCIYKLLHIYYIFLGQFVCACVRACVCVWIDKNKWFNGFRLSKVNSVTGLYFTTCLQGQF